MPTLPSLDTISIPSADSTFGECLLSVLPPSLTTISAGALLIGVLVSYVLFGVTTTQAYLYSGRFPNDSGKMKTLVAFVWFCELAHVVCIGHTLYVVMVSDFGHPERLGNIPISLDTSTLFNALVGMCAQGFFSFRIYRLCKRLYIPLLTWTLSFLFLGGTAVVFVMGLQSLPFATFETQWGWLLNSIWSIAAANDLIIALALVFYLARGRDESDRITPVVDKLIAWTIETGVVTSAAAILNLVCFVTMKNNYIWIAWYFVTARFYSISFLASLNSRATLRSIHEISVSQRQTRPSINTLTSENFLAEMRSPDSAFNAYLMK
ncbi:hypothetical protein MVEN_01566100 [Mycena venus]|uniref:DUF6534 domain-containing protein n=1 Tax=Mycena venus TaxID=2733690 RepID=A0A8H7CS56_9AGAR|nr:hypothetical protein MVEN_01566100 [Mycena venus]